MSISSMTSYAILGSKTLMQVISAVIIGGSLMSGGKGEHPEELLRGPSSDQHQ